MKLLLQLFVLLKIFLILGYTPKTGCLTTQLLSVSNMSNPIASTSKGNDEGEPVTFCRKNEDTRCVHCYQSSRKLPKSEQIVLTDQSIQRISEFFEEDLRVGSLICKKCYGSLYKRASKRARVDEPVPTQNVQHAQTSQGSQSSNFSESPPIPSQQSSGELYEVPEKKEIEYVNVPFARTIISHGYCFICRAKNDIVDVPEEARLQVFSLRQIYIPKRNRCCLRHLIQKRLLYRSEVDDLTIYSNECSIPSSEFSSFMSRLSNKVNEGLFEHIGDWSISDARLKVFTGLTSDELKDLVSRMKSLRASENRNAIQAVVTCLFKLRTGNSDEVIASILDLRNPRLVSHFCTSVLNSFEVDILPKRFGPTVYTRDYLIKNHTSPIANKLFNIGDRLTLICDGTYVSHEKSANNAYQRKSYSGQKKKPLCKPMTICTTDGFVVDLPGPFYGTQNDATIMKLIMEDPNGIRRLLKPGDIFILDRGFRDVKSYLEGLGFVVMMPALKGNQKQLSTVEANESRKVTKCRWVVEAVHGIIGRKCKLLHNQVDNKLLPKIGLYARIACYLHNEYGRKLNSDSGMEDAIFVRMTQDVHNSNQLALEVEEKRWNRRSSLLLKVTSNDIQDFPEMTENDLKILFTGSYQLSQAVSYLAEIYDDDGNIALSYVKESPDTIKFEVRSRHINRKMYKCFVKYDSRCVGIRGIVGYCCECANGLRTIGCCSHVASIIYYLSHARYLSQIIRPAEILSRIFEHEGVEPVIADDSEYED
ncbi:hypothetical protein QAD02_019554 [Eretmocerus hayati]|uniref:Uncharacterized protein n=4 Tax=Eretmocerus hayati TaxID=131215 RepID=A0ACC2PJW8_9HYME|nr:hypothetical protein QAD02_019554 [Eretmocerus hayati]